MDIHADHNTTVVAVGYHHSQAMVKADHDSTVFLLDASLLRDYPELVEAVAYAIKSGDIRVLLDDGDRATPRRQLPHRSR